MSEPRLEIRTSRVLEKRFNTEPMRQYKVDKAFKDMKKFYKQFTVNYLLNPEKWTRPKVNTERSQMNNRANANRYTSSPSIISP